MAFAYFLVFPIAFKFFASVTPTGVTMMTDINKYLDFVIDLFLAFGFAFEIPIATFLMVATGLTTTQDLAAKRPYVIVGCFIVGAVFTPPDVISQVMLAVPMWALFEGGLLLSRLPTRRTPEHLQAPE
jgi:sec-independent protein translocase protein TatC